MANKVHAGPIELPNPLVVEGLASAAYYPGQIVAKSGNNLAAGGTTTAGQLLIAKEFGPGQGGHIDDTFTIGDPICAYVARQGLFFRVRVATAQALTSGQTLLERGASGRLVVLASGVAVAVAKETVTTSANDQLVLVEAL